MKFPVTALIALMLAGCSPAVPSSPTA